MAFYGILTELADDRQPYDVVPDFAKLDLGGAKTFQMRWPGNNADDVETIDVFGALADARIKLQVDRNVVGPVPPATSPPGWNLSFSPTPSGQPGSIYTIHKGLRIPYRYRIPVTNSDPPNEMPHANIFILWTGHGGYP